MATDAATLAPPVALQVLGACPSCAAEVVADANAVRYDDHWYHVRCALEQQAAHES
jgi:hypothetical protein